MERQLGLHFGALAETFSKQLKEQGFIFDEKKVAYFEKLKECITHLMFSGILNDSEMRKAENKLFTQIKKHIASKNK